MLCSKVFRGHLKFRVEQGNPCPGWGRWRKGARPELDPCPTLLKALRRNILLRSVQTLPQAVTLGPLIYHKGRALMSSH